MVMLNEVYVASNEKSLHLIYTITNYIKGTRDRCHYGPIIRDVYPRRFFANNAECYDTGEF